MEHYWTDPWNEKFRVPGSIGTGSDTHSVPDHLLQREVQFKDLYATFEEYMADWCGCKERDPKINRYGYWENLNAKWDWYELGGRWLGFFKLKHPNAEAKLGQPGLFFVKKKKFDCDQARKDQIDFEFMANHEAEKAKRQYETVERFFGGSIPKIEHLWKDIVGKEEFKDMDIDEKRELYRSQPALKQLMEIRKTIDNRDDITKEDKSLMAWMEMDDFQVSKDEFIRDYRASSGIPFAIVKNGKWFQRGEMGWWGVVSDKKDQKEWNNQFCTLISDLPDHTLLSLYDCHI